MKRLTAILSLCFWGFLSATAQQTPIQITIDEQQAVNGYFTHKVPLTHFAVPDVQILAPVYADAPARQAVSVPDGNIQVVIGMERKQPFAYISIPVFSAGKEQGSVQRLTECLLQVTESGSQVKVLPPARTTTGGSVLVSGDWFKIAVADRGIYKVDYEFIKGLGADPATVDTRNIRLFGNGGTMMSENNALGDPSDPMENAIQLHDGGDNKLDPGDYFLFYANGPDNWRADSAKKTFYHVKHLYEEKSYYFLSFDQGAGLRLAESAGTGANVSVNSFDHYQVHEQELVNVGKFGKRWWGEDFGIDPGRQPSRSFSFNTGSPDSATFRIAVGSRSAAAVNTFTISLNGEQVWSAPFGSIGSAEDAVIHSKLAEFRHPVAGGSANLDLTYSPGDYTGRGYLDYIEIISRRPLSFSNMLVFRDWNAVGNGHIASYELQQANPQTTVWDLTDPLRPVRMAGTLNGSVFSFTRDASRLREFIAFDGSSYLKPESVGKIENQNLHGTPPVDYIIVTHEDFEGAANRLADFHRQVNGLRVVVATTGQVYNEFGSGSQDLGAIRDFARLLYRNAGSDSSNMPRYLLLFGDASYDYKDRIANNTNFVPTWETTESEDGINGYCSDDYFSFLDDHEHIEGMTPFGSIVNTMDVGVGRLPVTTPEAADRIVTKIMNYASPASLGPWRLSTTIMADDGDGNLHFKDGEDMARTINNHTNLYNENKVYVSALPLVSTPGGLRCPDANKSINDQIYKGTFLMNYNGHGSTTTLAHERILTQDDFNNWRNETKLPIMVTATCTFSKYDDPGYVSAGEQLIVKPDGGAIALLTTTQLVYQYLNHQLNVNFLNAFFRKYDGKWPTFGDAFRIGKNATYINPGQDQGTLGNFRKFALLGDPALIPAFPRHNIQTESILDGFSMQPVDTMKALGKYQISGSIRDEAGEIIPDFNGRVYVTIYDKPKVSKTLTGPERSFAVQNNIIYRGKATVTNGYFSFTFITPKDINYDMGKGKISYYAENGITDGAGSDTTLSIGGSSDVVIDDDGSPLVKPFMNDSLFRDGGITGPSSVLYVQLFDESGINVSGNSIGHDLTAVLDGDLSNPYVLNEYYETAPNDYRRGYVNFPVTGLSEGRHTFRVKAWDMFNNSGEGTVQFEVIDGKVVEVLNLMNYPNPFSDKTHFVFEHNHPGEKLKVQINIYSTSGYLVRTLAENFTAAGSRSNEIIWDGTDNNGAKLPAGLYVYRLNLATEKGIQATAHQKLILIR